MSPTAPPNNIAFYLPIGVIVCPNRANGLSPKNYVFSSMNLIDYIIINFYILFNIEKFLSILLKKFITNKKY